MNVGVRYFPDLACVYCTNSGHLVRKGYFYRAHDARWIPRFSCKLCRRKFSSASLSPCFRQKKRKLNSEIARFLCSEVSQRRLALNLGVTRRTIERKFLFLADQARQDLQAELDSRTQLIEAVQFDEMESFERSKCLPLSIPLLVETKTRKILGFGVVQMPAKGPLSRISLKKYGPRPDHRKEGTLAVLGSLKPKLSENVLIESDEKPAYPPWIKTQLPQARHETFKGRKGAVVGQGELKKVGRDPLFSLNHTAAMLRANINCLIRKTWCTTKRPDRLLAHITLYAQFHNRVLTQAAA